MIVEHTHPRQLEFLSQLANVVELAMLFDYIPEAYFYAKDVQGQFLLMNRPEMELHGLTRPEQMVGKTDFDFHPHHLAEQYVREDRRVMVSGESLPNQVWLVGDARGQLRWFLSTKTPLRNASGEVIGIAGIMRDLKQTESLLRPYQEMEGVLAYVLANFAERLRMDDLARQVHLSVSQFDRRFKHLFRMTPLQYVLRVRIHAASQALLQTGKSIAAIADESGFYDQSSFTKQFARHTGLTPRNYRRKFSTASQPVSASTSGPASEAGSEPVISLQE